MAEPALPSSFANRDGVIWFDGELVPWQEAKVHVLTHSLHYGLAVFEGVRGYKTPKGTMIFRLEDHTRRLFNSAHILQMQIPYSEEELNQAQRQVFSANGLEEGYLRPIVFFGCEAMGLRAENLSVHVAIAAWEWPDYMSPEARERGITMRTSSYTRHHVNITMCKSKAAGNYINSVLALREAVDSGCDEALLLDNEGYVTEGSGENIFVVTNGAVHTPELTSCLDGITRRTVIEFLSELNVPVIERRITRDEVYIADEVFVSGTAAEVLPVCSLDRRVIGEGRRGPITSEVQSMYLDQVRGLRDNSHPEWHSNVGATHASPVTGET